MAHSIGVDNTAWSYNTLLFALRELLSNIVKLGGNFPSVLISLDFLLLILDFLLHVQASHSQATERNLS